MHPATGKAEHNNDPSFGLDMGENRSEDVCLTIGKRRLNRLEDIGDVSLKASKPGCIKPQLDASRAGLL